MRRVLALSLAIAVLGIVAPGAWAQAPPAAPIPQVTITGFIDTITSATRNLQDTRYDRFGDSEWYARNRGRVDIVGQLAAAKFVLGLEIDQTWGQTGAADNGTSSQLATARATSASGACPAGTAGCAVATTTGNRFGTNGSFDLNTDAINTIEVKWLYTAFPLPMIPVPTLLRL